MPSWEIDSSHVMMQCKTVLITDAVTKSCHALTFIGVPVQPALTQTGRTAVLNLTPELECPASLF
jgi:hypothetical protein